MAMTVRGNVLSIALMRLVIDNHCMAAVIHVNQGLKDTTAHRVCSYIHE